MVNYQDLELGTTPMTRLSAQQADSDPVADDLNACRESNGIRPREYKRRLRSRSREMDIVPVGVHGPTVLPEDRGALLTPCQEIILAKRVEGGDRAATERLVNSNMRLVMSIAQRYQGRGLPLEDLMQEGTIGLLHAVDKYNWRKGFRFSTYATHWIRQAIMRAIANSGRGIRLPAYVVDTIGRLTRIRGELENRFGRTPTRSELAKAADMSEDQLSLILKSMIQPASLDAPVGEQGEQRLGEFIPAEESQGPYARVYLHAVQEEVSRAIKSLTPREQEVLRLRFGLEGREAHTLEEVGKALHITRERARQIENQALERLRSSRAGARLHESID